jgi:hypothetical protein
MTEQSTTSRDEVASMLLRLGMAKPDPAMLARAVDLSAGLASVLQRLPRDFGKDREPAHVFAVPLR